MQGPRYCEKFPGNDLLNRRVLDHRPPQAAKQGIGPRVERSQGGFTRVTRLNVPRDSLEGISGEVAGGELRQQGAIGAGGIVPMPTYHATPRLKSEWVITTRDAARDKTEFR